MKTESALRPLTTKMKSRPPQASARRPTWDRGRSTADRMQAQVECWTIFNLPSAHACRPPFTKLIPQSSRGQSGAGWCATAGLRHPNLMQGTGQLWVQFNILKANTAFSACRLSKREAFRSFEGWKPILRGTWEGARKKQPGAQCWLVPSSPLSQAKKEKEKDLNHSKAIYMKPINCLIVEYQSGLSRTVFTSNWTYSGTCGLL